MLAKMSANTCILLFKFSNFRLYQNSVPVRTGRHARSNVFILKILVIILIKFEMLYV